MNVTFSQLVDYLTALGVESVDHSQRTYMDHLITVYRYMEAEGCDTEACRAGMFHSIYGTEKFQGFTIPLEKRDDIRALIGERAEQLAYCNCFMDRASFDRAAEQDVEPFRIRHRVTGEELALTRRDFDDLCRVHLYDWLEQAPRSRHGWNYRRQEYRRLAQRLGPRAIAALERVYALEPKANANDPSPRDARANSPV
jgi:hypothetical protein